LLAESLACAEDVEDEAGFHSHTPWLGRTEVVAGPGSAVR